MPGTKTISLSLDEGLVETLDEEIAAHDISRTEYIRYIIKVRHDRAEHKRDLERASERIEELRGQLRDAEGRIENFETVVEELRREREELRGELERASERIEDVERAYESETARTEKLRAENDELRRERHELEADLERTESRVETLLQQADEMINPLTEGKSDSEPTISRANSDRDKGNKQENGDEKKIERTNGPAEEENGESTESGSDELTACAAQLRSYID